MEVAPGIHRIDSVTGGRPLQLYLLVGGDRTVLVDAGGSSEPENVIFPYLEGIGLTPSDLDMVVVTHSDHDHFGGLGAIKRANPSVLLTCGEQDRFMVEDPDTTYSFRYNHYEADHDIKFDDAAHAAIMQDLGTAQQVDFTWSGGETLRIAPDWVLEIHHVPGHTYGHLCVFDTKNKAIFGGDAVQGSVYPSVEGGAALGPTYLYVDSYLMTIRYLKSLGAEMLCLAHWPVKHGDEVGDFLDESHRYVVQADRLILEALQQAKTGVTMRDLIAELGPELGDWPREADELLAFSFAGHLERFEGRGLVKRDSKSKPVRFSVT
jgi:glyoxylase-like metal-dependent hydrolase (beta-lactamase superfamily II)